MIISSIRKRRNGVEVIFDDNSKILVDYRVVVDNGLRKNDDLTTEQVNKLLAQSEKLKLKDSAFRLLGMRHHSKYEIAQKLIRKGFERQGVETILNELVEKGFLNDTEFAKAYFTERQNKKRVGINKIRAELIKKGIDKKIIEDLLAVEDSSISEETAFELASKKLKSLIHKESDARKIKQKISASLFSKGFDFDLIRKTIDKLNLSEDQFEDL
jgi:regulatory protein